ncbi:serine/threonine-protein phosphatase 6 regulatory ankyrin repeat subunit A-like protein [Dinothrombium tinctorium]|uniref:Alpha-latrotoxin n=1 Tax=Dinothrombium tinctorium TaxID=1965070 RepID=A0A443QLQ6_9ACAR|nr:serine/threonine-protein phosphatase 6 regulatory ankyrin repeat subunit A-like protein [Dinothrombium tinctorium]
MHYSDQPKMAQAILKGEIHTVKHCISNGEDVNAADFERRTYLHLAAFVNAAEIAKILIAAGARIQCRDNEWLTPLHRACRNNADAIVALLIEKGADVNCRDRNFVTPLHVCAANNALECARLFISKVPNIDVTDRSGATALHHAAFNGNCDVIQFLLKHGASPNAYDKLERRPIHYAATVDNTDAIRLLVNSGGLIDVRDKDMLTPLHIASAKGSLNAIQTLVELGANINTVDASGNTPLHWACLHGQDDVIDELITSGASLNAVNHMGVTPLHYAAASILGTPALEVLMRHKDNLLINACDKAGRTPLHLAAKFGRLNRVLDLIRYGADVNATDKQLLTALHYAARGGHSPVIETLIAQSNIKINILDISGMTPLHHVAFSGVSDACQRLLKSSKAALSINDVSGRSPHFFAALSGNRECLQLMEPLPSHLDSLNRSLLHYAAASASYESLRYLLQTDLNLNVNHRDIFGRTPLLYAAASDDDGRCVEALISAGARIDIPDNDGYYCVNYAAAAGKSCTLEVLYTDDFIANIWSKVKFKLCPSYCAAFFGRSECLEFLLSKGVIESIAKCMEYATVTNHMDCLQKIINHDSISQAIFCNAIHLAALKSHIDCLCCIFTHIEEVDIVDEKMRTPLMFAALNCQANYDCIEMLLKKNSNVNAIDKFGRNVLFYACFSGHENSVRAFLARGANLLQRDVNNKTVFHLAAAMGHSDVLCSLISALSAIKLFESISHESLVDRDLFTPLHWACLKSQHNTVTILLENLKMKTFYGNSVSPLHISALVGSEKCMELLLSHYGQGIVHLVDSKGRTALHYLCMSKKETKECLSLLLHNRVEVNACDENKRTALMYCIQRGFTDTALTLLSNGGDPSIEDRKGNNSLHYACLMKMEEIGLRIVEKCPSLVNSTNCDLKTPLHIAASNGLYNLTQKLLLGGASVTASDIENQTPSLCCAKNSDVAECLMLIESIMIFEELNKKASLDAEEASAFSPSISQLRESRGSFLKRASAQLFASSSFESCRTSFSPKNDQVSNECSSIIGVSTLNSNNSKSVDKENNSSDSDFY